MPYWLGRLEMIERERRFSIFPASIYRIRRAFHIWTQNYRRYSCGDPSLRKPKWKHGTRPPAFIVRHGLIWFYSGLPFCPPNIDQIGHEKRWMRRPLLGKSWHSRKTGLMKARGWHRKGACDGKSKVRPNFWPCASFSEEYRATDLNIYQFWPHILNVQVIRLKVLKLYMHNYPYHLIFRFRG